MTFAGWEEEETSSAFPGVIGAPSYYTNASSATSNSIPYPAATVAGELLLLFVGTVPSPTITLAGWTLILDVAETSGVGRRLRIYSKVATGAEGGTSQTMTFSTAQAVSTVMCRLAPNSVVSVAAANGSSTTPNSPALTPATGVRKTLWISAVYARGSSYTAFPVGYSEIRVQGMLAVMGLTKQSATEDPSSYAMSPSDNWAAATLAIRGP